MNPRGYQEDFYDLYEGVQDRASRISKARKIAFSLETFISQPLASATCLDIGCSSGFITLELAPLFSRMVGVEYDKVALRNVPRVTPSSMQFVCGDAMNLPVADGAVDVVICAQVYEHVPDDVQLFSEIYRVLKPGGSVFFSGPNKLFPIEPHYFLPFLHWLPSSWADAYLRLLGRGNHYYERSRTPAQLRELFSDFTIRDVTLDIIQAKPDLVAPRRWASLLMCIPTVIWRMFLPALPNFNWILAKPHPPVISIQNSESHRAGQP